MVPLFGHHFRKAGIQGNWILGLFNLPWPKVKKREVGHTQTWWKGAKERGGGDKVKVLGKSKQQEEKWRAG